VHLDARGGGNATTPVMGQGKVATINCLQQKQQQSTGSNKNSNIGKSSNIQLAVTKLATINWWQ